MRINHNISFPYPVLGHRKGIDSVADATLEETIQDDYYVWDVAISHNNEDIDDLVSSQKVRYACEVDCQDTYYRNSFYPDLNGDQKHIKVKIKKTEIGGRVNIVVTALAVEKLNDYHNSKSTGIYTNYSFDLEPGDILAIFGEWTIDLDIKAYSYKHITNIVQLRLVDSSEVEINLNDKKSIIIELPRTKFEQHVSKLKNPLYQPVLLASIVFEALSRALQHLKENEDTTWARVLELKAEKDLGYENVKSTIAEDPDTAFEITRKILEDPYYKLYNLLDRITDNEEHIEN